MFKLPQRLECKRGPIDLAPAIDIVLSLMIFFMLSSALIIQPGMKVDPPSSIYGEGSRANRYIVTITFRPARENIETGELDPPAEQIFFNDQLMTYEELTTAFGQIPVAHRGRPVVLQADRKISLGYITRIMNAAMDSGLAVVLATHNPEVR